MSHHDETAVTALLQPEQTRGAGARWSWVTPVFGASVTATRVAGSLVLGRDASCEIPIDDAAASRQHAEVRLEAGSIVIRDLASRNGTFVDGARVAEVTVGGEPVLLRIGETLLRVGALPEEWAPPTGPPLVGGVALASVRRKIALVAPTDLPVLLLGETGTGKDVVARMLHDASGREGAFVPVNCAALPDALVESELFGHARSAFTGADRARRGLFTSAHGGTLFLDEVGDLPPTAQAKLLRVLEDGRVRPVGGEGTHGVDVRVISATNRDLHARVACGEFRADLLARLAGVEFRLPPLRDRFEDVPVLAAHLLERAGYSSGLSCDAAEALCLASWPMNVRQLAAVLRGVMLTGATTIRLTDLSAQLGRPTDPEAPPPRAASAPRAPADADDLAAALRAHGGNVRRVSRALGLSRAHVYRLLKRNALDPASFRARSLSGDGP